ncbi:MAG: hypothetical protein ACFB14_14230 [Leptolyngbyaceae cyanobacterium]
MNWINQIGNWNPQFLRECRGHLKPRSVIATLGTSAVFQILFCALVFQNVTTASQIDARWLYVCRILMWLLPYFIFIAGGYYLVNDLTQEEKKGTLNFIRLSPRPAREILLGKLLGVPILPYLVVLSVVPLHIFSMVQIGVPPTFFFSYYTLLGATAFFYFSLALLAGITQNLQPKKASSAIIFAAFSLLIFSPFFMFWNINTSWRYVATAFPLFDTSAPRSSIAWLYTSLTEGNFWAYGFTLINLIIVTGLVWWMLERLFHQPKTTLISKRCSYLLTAYINVLIWGFFQHRELVSDPELFVGFQNLYLANLGLVLFFLLALTPRRQQLFDWLSYSKTNLATRLWMDKSPAFSAVGVNILIAGLLVWPWLIVVLRASSVSMHFLIMPLSIVLSWLIYAAIAQIIFTSQVRSPALWTAGSILLLIIVPLIALVIFQNGTAMNPLWMVYRTVFGYPFSFYDETPSGLVAALYGGMALQGVVLAVLVTVLRRRLQQLRRLVQSPRG